jgi:hypothetical protein
MFVNGSKLNEQPLLRTFQGYVSYQISIHPMEGPDPLTSMAATGNSYFRFVDF